MSRGAKEAQGTRMQVRTIAVINATGRQAASVTRVASAVGHRIRAHVQSKDGLVAKELAALPNVELLEGSLDDKSLIADLFRDAHWAFINTLPFGDEVAMGRSLADAARRAGVKHYVYSSMPDHSVYGKGWPTLPHWSVKFTVENYVRQLSNLPSTFVYAGIYNNNFTSLPYPLFCMELQKDGSFRWKAPFPPDMPLPWLDAEHDVGPAVLQIFKDGPRKWAGQRIALAFELLTPRQACAAFSRGVGRPVKYVQGPIEIKVPIPTGYKEQLEGIELLFGKYRAPYFGLELDPSPDEALQLWEGYRSLEEYAGEAFLIEERLNGLTWMTDNR
ncbi:MAG: hypothetical protein M4579_006289 [Chaenotheca gracillima]|nr:MAG: hypothetical protein M4579_006289 [Chaenotheca gracillima]